MSRGSAARQEEVFPVADLPVHETPRVRKPSKTRRLVNTPVTTISIGASTITPEAQVREWNLQGLLKRSFDLVGAGTILMLTSPIMGIIALLVRLSSPGPVIIRQTRLTTGGKTFQMYKFRSMRSDAEVKSGPVLAQENDTRVTPIGRIIRLTRLDELPQCINVLKGEMSLIGPRPERPEIARQMREKLPQFDRRLEVKAGLTGLAQVEMGYSSCADSYRRKLAFDRLYVQRQSLLLDFWIAVRTVWVMCTGRGAR